MMNRTISPAVLALMAAVLLGACSSEPKGVRLINGGTSAIPAQTAAPVRALTAAEITSTVVGKTYQFTRGNSSGFVTYNADGTLTIKDDQKGASIGKWTANGSQYCESYSAAEPMQCGEFKNTGNAFFAGSTHLVEMQI